MSDELSMLVTCFGITKHCMNLVSKYYTASKCSNQYLDYLTSQHLIQKYPNAPPVSIFIVALGLYNLRSHVFHGSTHWIRSAWFINLFCQSKICQHDLGRENDMLKKRNESTAMFKGKMLHISYFVSSSMDQSCSCSRVQQDYYMSITIHENIFWFEVSMHDPSLVKMWNSRNYLSSINPCLVLTTQSTPKSWS